MKSEPDVWSIDQQIKSGAKGAPWDGVRNYQAAKNLEWMGTLCDAKQTLYNKYTSIIHVDGTCRTQIIKDKNSITYKILKNMKNYGSDILVNTSFNISKDPVVFDLYDVYVNLKRMKIKFVLMDDGLYQTKDL